MVSQKLRLITSLICYFLAISSQASPNDAFKYPFYLGLTGGYGSTTWGYLVPSEKNAGVGMSVSTPTSVREGGILWGIFGGYEFSPFFAIEGSYNRYPTTKIYFDTMSLFTFKHDNITKLSSNTENTTLSAKFMIVVPHTNNVRAYSSAGIAGVHRYDVITDRWRASPTFGVGFNYNLTEQMMAEVGINYTGGYGESELDPAEDYVPFLYSGFFRLAYRF